MSKKIEVATFFYKVLIIYYMKSVATNEFPEIEWEIGEMISKDIDERMEVFVATGEDAAGNKYEAEAYYYGNELEEIKHIEKV